jgi:hypothetical protein
VLEGGGVIDMLLFSQLLETDGDDSEFAESFVVGFIGEPMQFSLIRIHHRE